MVLSSRKKKKEKQRQDKTKQEVCKKCNICVALHNVFYKLDIEMLHLRINVHVHVTVECYIFELQYIEMSLFNCSC